MEKVITDNYIKECHKGKNYSGKIFEYLFRSKKSLILSFDDEEYNLFGNHVVVSEIVDRF